MSNINRERERERERESERERDSETQNIENAMQQTQIIPKQLPL